MASWENVVRSRTELAADSVARLRLLIQEWSLVADLGFSDLVLFVRTWDAAGWIAIAHVRPSTSPTVFADDPVGMFIPRSRGNDMERARQSGERSRGAHAQPEAQSDRARLAAPMEAVPVGGPEGVIAVVGRYSTIDSRRIGEMESNYLSACDALLSMVVAGHFPVSGAEAVDAAAPRVGDGMLRLDAGGRVRYASPNARTCLRRLGVSDPVVGVPLSGLLGRLGRKHAPLDQAAVRIATGAAVGEAEFVSNSAIVTVRSIPLQGPASHGGAVVLMRDVTELRSRERALLSKDATIREIHHRVKNNLQTVGALLRLQARRLPAGEPRAALLDAVARVGTIAMVHESLASSPGEQVDFDEISRRLLAMARDAAAAADHEPPDVVASGSFGVLPSEVATPLAMVLSELLLNAMEHSGARRLWIEGGRSRTEVHLMVTDNGSGFDPWNVEGLGLQIVLTLVRDQLHGELSIQGTGYSPWPGYLTEDPWAEVPSRSGTAVRIVCPLS